jgi:hypothetical protein
MQDLSVGRSLEIYCRTVAQSESMSSLFWRAALFSRAAKQQRATCQFPEKRNWQEIFETCRPISAQPIPQSQCLGHGSLLLAVPQSVLIEQGIHFFRNTIRQRR